MATMVPPSDLSKGTILELEGSLFTVLEHHLFKAGKGNSEARVRVKMRDVRTGFTQEKVWRTDDRVPKASVDNREMRFLYRDGDLFHFMDSETFEEKILSAAVLGGAEHYLSDGMTVQAMVFQENPISVQLPASVDLKIVRADPGFKGDTAQGGSKKATLETGLVVDVPLFVNEGETIKVDTRTGGYLSRVG